ncbi:MAG: asparaginase domain-containing protein [candidate division SR1 bacterium]|nr:asparaginase domain-containing protein [candidate division SR1 bacterium]
MMDLLQFVKDPLDLANLEIIDPVLVQNFVKRINSLENIGDKKLIIAIGTGGTISMEEQDTPTGKILVPSLDFPKIFARVEPGLNNKFQVESLDAYAIDSANMKFSNVHDLVIVINYISKNIQNKFLGFLILHGTDTMAEASGHLAAMFGDSLQYPVVYTGAQHSIVDPMHDAGLNIRNSIYALEGISEAGFADVVITFGDGIILSCGAKKVSDISKNAFESPMHELIADLSKPQYPIGLHEKLLRRAKDNTGKAPRVYSGYTHLLEINSKIAMSPEQIIRQIQDPMVHGVLLVTYGAGTADDDIINAISKTTREKGISAFAASPINSDPALHIYESAKKMRNIGIEPLYMTPEFARAKFEIAIRECKGNVTEVSKFMGIGYIGEIPTAETRRKSPLLRF